MVALMVEVAMVVVATGEDAMVEVVMVEEPRQRGMPSLGFSKCGRPLPYVCSKDQKARAELNATRDVKREN